MSADPEQELLREADGASIERLWQSVLDDFDSEEAHQALLRHCLAAERLPEVARRYREHQQRLGAADPQRQQVEARLSAIAALALSRLEPRRREPLRRHPVATVLNVAVGLMFLAALASLIGALLF